MRSFLGALGHLLLFTVVHSADISDGVLNPDRPVKLHRKHRASQRQGAASTTTRSRSTTRKHFSMKLGPNSFMTVSDTDEKYDDFEPDTSLPGHSSTVFRTFKSTVKSVSLPFKKKPLSRSPSPRYSVIAQKRDDDGDSALQQPSKSAPSSSTQASSLSSLPPLRAVLSKSNDRDDVDDADDQTFQKAIASISGSQINQVNQQMPGVVNLNGFRPVSPPAIPNAATMPVMVAAIPLPPSLPSNTTAGPPSATTLPGFLVGSPYPFVMEPPDIPYFGSKWNGPWGYPIGHYQAFRGTGQYITHYRYYPISYYSSLLAPFASAMSG
ncbi:hypothetical protein RvY_12641 [Ramazzottius varieornatus]|uniref:Uncharacterized protein n=1 Tax=Ramazzottius varieornatus TaxID=947166 RepID=A0A1D1VK87_RAMVA|nr:hypothetical protein RvY_12641 [Ramazzottius varieornatus]